MMCANNMFLQQSIALLQYCLRTPAKPIKVTAMSSPAFYTKDMCLSLCQTTAALILLLHGPACPCCPACTLALKCQAFQLLYRVVTILIVTTCTAYTCTAFCRTTPVMLLHPSTVQSRDHPLLDMQPASGLNRPPNQPRQPSSTSSKIDPTQVPRPSAKGDAPEEYRTLGNQYPNPPTTQARFIVRDTGNANPRFMRCTLGMMPYSNDLLKQSAMPLAVVVQPFALLDPADDATEVSHSALSSFKSCACLINTKLSACS